MSPFLLLGITFAIIEWVAVAAGRRRLEYLAKPAALLFLVLWFSRGLASPPSALGGWFVAGLVLSLAGDIFLLIPGDYFLPGLGAFLLAHIAYVAAFNASGPLLNASSLAIACLIAVLAAWLVSRLRAGLRARGRARLLPPVALYACVLALSLWSALCTLLRPDWPPLAAGLVAVGAGFFFLSDTMLAWNRFVRRLPGERLPIMMTYHVGQFCLAGGVLLALGRF